MSGMKLAKPSSSRQFSHFRGLAVRYSRFPKVFIDFMNTRNESEQTSCKVSPTNMFLGSKVSSRLCDKSKGAFVCEDNNEIGTENIAEVNTTLEFVGDFSECFLFW